MHIQNRGSFAVTVILLIFLLVFFGLALTYGPKEKLIPLGVLIPCIFLTVLLLLGEKYPELVKKFDVKANLLTRKSFKKNPSSDEAATPEDSTHKVVIICLWSAAFLAIVFLAGFLIAIPIYLLLFLKFYGRISGLKAGVVALITWAAVYVFFEILLGEELFRGILFEAYVPPI